MDRNSYFLYYGDGLIVALRKESVDRNDAVQIVVVVVHTVALRKESVDRNALSALTYHLRFGSLSARRAWIEISQAASCQQRSHRRSPQGERG